MTAVAVPSSVRRSEINSRLGEIQVELDRIRNTSGMNRRRLDLGAERDRLLDELIEMR